MPTNLFDFGLILKIVTEIVSITRLIISESSTTKVMLNH